MSSVKTTKWKSIKTIFFNSNNIKKMLRLYSTSFRGLFRKHWNETFLQKNVNCFSQKKLHRRCSMGFMPISLYAVIGVHVVSPKTILEQSKLVLNILTRQLIHFDWVFLFKTKGSSFATELYCKNSGTWKIK